MRKFKTKCISNNHILCKKCVTQIFSDSTASCKQQNNRQCEKRGIKRRARRKHTHTVYTRVYLWVVGYTRGGHEQRS